MFIKFICCLLFIVVIDGSSAGAGSCDAVGVCRMVDDKGAFVKAECPKGMELVDTPSRSNAYTVRTADGSNKGADPKSYVPDRLMDIHIRVTEADKKYIGLLIYAVSGESATELGARGCNTLPRKIPTVANQAVTQGGCTVTETKVGEWDLPAGEPFHGHICGKTAATHTGAELKNYHHILRFKTPPKGTGAIHFRAIVKRGPTQTGEFYWPMTAGDLTLTESAPSTDAVAWIKGQVGENCDRVCFNSKQNEKSQVCDAASLTATNGQQMYEGIKDDLTCKLPLLSSCATTAPSTEEDWCWLRRADCATAAPTCASVGSLISRICPCKEGTANPDNLGPEAGSGAGAVQGSSFNTLTLAFAVAVSVFLM